MMSDNCGCGDEIPMISQSQLPPRDSIDVVGEGEIVVDESIGVNGVKIFTVKRVVYTPPVINATANPTREVGTENDFTWNVNIIQGRESIVLRTIAPPGADLSGPFSVSTEDDTRTTRGFNSKYVITVKDEANTQVTRTLGIQYYNKVRQWFSYKDGINQEITEDDILNATGTIAENIKSVYGGARNYAIPASGVLQYVYWAYESGTTPINAMTLNGLPFPITFLPGSVEVTNPHNNAIVTNFTIVRSTNKFGTTTLPLVML